MPLRLDAIGEAILLLRDRAARRLPMTDDRHNGVNAVPVDSLVDARWPLCRWESIR